MASISPELQAHREWLGQIQQVGLVVSPQVLANNGVFVDRQRSVEAQARLRELLPNGDDEAPATAGAAGVDFSALTREVLGWPDGLLAGSAGGPALPDTLTIALPEHEDVLSPSLAIPEPEKPGEWLALVSVVNAGGDLDKPSGHDGWRVSPHARLERLLRETRVPVGLLFNGHALRLLYAPHGESSGHLTFRLDHLAETLGRPMLGALCALLDPLRVTAIGIEQQRLPHLLRESRRYQNDVSTALAGQVLEALWELLRGFQRADQDAKGTLLGEVLRERPADVYGGLLTTMMRLVFVLYAEDRGLMPQGEVYQRHHGVSGLFERLREDAARYPDTMDARYGAWAQLLVLFRLVHDGGGHGDLRFPPRHGRLFDPDAYPFLEGRPHGSRRQLGEVVETPRVADGVVFRVLDRLLMLDGERLSYRTLDVEQIGSVYEAMMGFALRRATGPAIAVVPKHVVFDVEELLAQKAKDRAAWLREQAELKLTGDALAKASTPADVVAALGKKVSRFTPHLMKAGDLFLQPTEERRRSGSHYTPRSLTAPIVRTTFRPIFARLGEQATPEQILDLKVCDPAMGSGAFLVEACRLLGERLVKAWEVHKATPKVPDDEDALTHARRLVAERCLYGVDKNVFAVDLAKLSLWLATLAREHPFTFLDHALRHGDSLVGLSREQIACLDWAPTKQLPLVRRLVDARVAEAQHHRLAIESMGASDDVAEKARLLREAEEAQADARLIGDVIVSAFFEEEKPKARELRRQQYAAKVQQFLEVGGSERLTVERELMDIAAGLRESDRPVPAFHWEIEFPEVFTRGNGGFDAFVGNPPFAGKNTIAAATRDSYLPWLLAAHERSHGNADLVAHFYRRAFDLLRRDGTFGLIATNTIAQGDTRGTGLRWIRQHGGRIFEARRRVKWPGAAAVVVSVVHVAKGSLPPPCVLDGRAVERITAFLFHTGGDDDPARLKSNADKSFQGSIVLGMGFTFDDTDKSGVANPISLMHELNARDPRNGERIFPYIGGEEVNDSPTHAHHRYVINFGQMSEAEARQWPDLMAIVEAKVRGTRASHSTAKWWHFERLRPELYEAIRGVERVLVCPIISNKLSFTFVPVDLVFSHKLFVFALSSAEGFAVLQSRLHELWARMFSSTMKDDLNYSGEDCFETFPFPFDSRLPASPSAARSGQASESDAALEAVGREYYEFRAALMVRNNEGLTKTYNRFHDRDHDGTGVEGRDPADVVRDIERLRALHDAMDRAVLDAYGWTDIRPTCEFILDYEDDEEETPGKASRRRKPWRYRWPDEIRDEVLGRLLELNAQRAREEELAGKADAASGAAGQGAALKKGAAKGRKKGGGATPLLD